MKKILCFLLTVIIGLSSLSLTAQETLTVADGSATNAYIPVYGFYTDAYLRAQIIYPSAMVSDMDGGTITEMKFYMSSIPGGMWGNTFLVRLGTTGSAAFATATFQQVTFTSVYTGPMDPQPNGLVTVTFSTPFEFEGGNLLVDVSSVNTGSYSSGSFWGISQTGGSISGYNYSDVASISPSARDFIPKTTFTYASGSSCTSPNELAVTNITNNSAVFSWHPRIEGTCYYAIVPAGTDLDEAEWIAATDTFVTLSGLSGGIQYAAYVKTDCGSEISSSPSILFYTNCDAVNTFPYFEGFEDDWIITNVLGQSNQTPLCWSVYNGGGNVSTYGSINDYRWKPNTSSGHVYEGNHSAVCYTDGAANPHNDWLISPMMDIPDNMQVSFWAQRAYDYTSEPDEISVWISDANLTLTAPAIDTSGLDTLPLPGFTQIFHVDLPQGPFNLYEVPLTDYTGNRYIAFVRRNYPNDGYFLCLDNVSVEEIPVCQRPSDQNTDSVGTDFAVLSWTSDANSYNLYYKFESADSFTVVTDVTLDADSQYLLNNLTPGNIYQWYVAAVCDDGTVLPATTVMNFQTECVPITTLPYYVDFENNIFGADGDLPACWSKPGYYTYPYVYDYSYYAHNGSNSLYSYSTTPVIATLPELDEEISISDLQLSFWAFCYYGTDAQIEVGVMTDPSDASSFTPIDSVIFNNGYYTEYTLDLASYEGTAHRLALRITCGLVVESYGSYPDPLYIDDLTLAAHASCPRPEDVTVIASTPTTATLSWISEENGFMVYYKSADMIGYVAANDSPVNDTTYTVENLTPGKDYSFYVSAICSDETETPSLVIHSTQPCIGLTTLPYFCGFEDNLVGNENEELPMCWNRGSANNSYPYVYDYDAYQGSHSLYSYYSNTVSMPPIDPEEIPFSDLQVSFYAKAYEGDILKVGVMSDPSNINTFVQVGDDIPLTNNYTLYEVSLANYQGNGTMVSFLLPSYTGFYMDNVTLDHLPDCQRPTITNVVFTNTEATVNWTEDENANAWQVVITSTYADPSSLTPEDVTENTYTFEDLTPNTFYQVYVRTDCGDQYSEWSNLYSFTTLNFLPAEVPYNCDFENEEENANWSLINGYLTNQWYIGTAINNTTDGQYSLYVSADSGATTTYNTVGANTVWAYRDFLFSDASEFFLSFDWRCMGEDSYYGAYDYMQVFIGTPTTVSASSYGSTPSSLVELGLFVNDSTWNTATITLDGTLYANTVQRIYFRWYNDYSGGSGISAAVDNIVISEVDCARPAALEMTTIGTTTATLTITPASESDAAWEVSLNDSVFTVLDTVVEFSELTPGTAYEIYVRTICDGGDTSVWSLPISFISECLLISTVPQTWDFETNLIGGSENYPLPVCWNRINNPESTYSEYPYTDSYGYTHSGFYSLYYYAGYPNCYGILPPIDSDVLNLQDLELSFFASQSGSSNNVSLVVGVMTDPTDASTFTAVQSITPTDVYPSDPYIVSFANYTGNGNYIAIKNQTNGYSYVSIYLDDVTLEEIPSCLPPTGVTVSNMTESTADVAWTENSEATSWTIRYFEVGNEDNATEVAVSTNPYTITGLTPGTFYIAQVRSECSASEASTWGTSPQFMTNCVAVTTFPYTEGFEGSDLGCWSNQTISGSNPWTISYYYANSGSQSISISYYVGSVSRLISPVFDLSGLSSPSVSLFFNQVPYYGIVDTFAVYYRTSATAEWVRIEGYNTATSGFESDTLLLPNPSATYQIAFFGYGINGDGIYLDDISVFGNSAVVIIDPTVTTNEATLIAQTTATLNGTITNPDNVTITAQGFEWKATAGGTYTPVTVTGNTLTYNLDNLTPNTGYTYKAFITFNGTTVYGDEVSFTTLEQGQPTEPSATTLPATVVTETTATLNGTIANPDDVTITAQGFEWKAVSAAAYTVLNATGATMSATVNNLTPNTNYTYRAFVTTANGTHYGSDVTFTTLEEIPEPCNVPTNLHTTDIQNEAISIAWDADANVTSWNVQYRPVGGTLATATTNTNSYTITGLTGLTIYEIQVQANCGNGNLSDWTAAITPQTTNVGIESYLSNSVVLFPNPAKEVINVQCTMYNVQSVEVIDVYGKVIKTMNVTENPTRINVSGLANGMYFVRVTTEEGTVTKNFIKK